MLGGDRGGGGLGRPGGGPCGLRGRPRERVLADPLEGFSSCRVWPGRSDVRRPAEILWHGVYGILPGRPGVTM